MNQSERAVMYLNKLIKLLKSIDLKDVSGILYPCIEDLVQNGLSTQRFSDQDITPTRQDITQYLLAWFKSNGIDADECRKWILEYSLDVLAPLSSGSQSKIRHSTKSNLKYIFQSGIQFECDCKHNPFRAVCSENCPVYHKMYAGYQKRKAEEACQTYEVEPLPQIDPNEFEFRPSVKEKYKEQYAKSVKMMKELFEQGMSLKDIVFHLNQKKLYSRTGVRWTYANLRLDAREKGLIRKTDRGVGQTKEQYHKQYEEALKIIRRERKKNAAAKKIVALLNSSGYKSRTGKKWTTGILWNELKK
jgi:hypothetical protein